MSGIGILGTIALLRANTTAFQLIEVEGYSSNLDGGEGSFWLNATDTTSSDNGGTIIVDAAGNRWYRQGRDQFINVKWFGATGNGGTDDTAAMQLAHNLVD
jgi:hypothetical protein